MHKSRLTWAVLAGVLALTLLDAPATRAAADRPCRPDIEKFCKDAGKGRARMAACLRDHAAELSAGCKAKMDAGEGVFATGRQGNPMLQACSEDQKKLCPGVKQGGGRIRQCLKKHQSELSAKCKSFFEGGGKRGGGLGGACRDDAQNLCKAIEPGVNALLDCLKKNESKLSQACRDALAKVGAGKAAKSN